MIDLDAQNRTFKIPGNCLLMPTFPTFFVQPLDDALAAIAAMPSRTSRGRFGPQSRNAVGALGAMPRRTHLAMRDAPSAARINGKRCC